jgi:SWI/SNF-related matrix-associated actin-dependent regulator of chromatin subfamily A-like protein 1
MAEMDANTTKILSVCSTLAMTQALSPNIKDGVGFSNADFPGAFVLVALGDVAGCAALLRLYVRQAAAAGVTADMLQPFLGDDAAIANAEARAALNRSKADAAGTLAWVQKPDGKILINGVGLSTEIRRQLKTHGERTPQGWVVAPDMLQLATEGAQVARGTAFREIMGQTPQKALAPARTGKAEKKPTVLVFEGANVNWTNPFDDLGKEVRTLAKLAGARWNGDFWALADPIAQAAMSILCEDLDVPTVGARRDPALQAAGEALAEEIRSGVVKALLVHDTENHVYYRLRSKVDGAWEAARNAGAVYDRDKFGGAIRVNKEDLRGVLAALDKVQGVDASPLLAVLAKYEADEAHRMAIPLEILESVPTHTKTGLEFYAHQREGIAYLMTLGWSDDRIKGGILADDMGLGKTIQAICAADARFPGERILIVCPASLKSNWQREIWTWLGPSETIQVVTGKSDTVDSASRWVIVNYDILTYYVDQLRAIGFGLSIADEAHNMRNTDTQRTRAFAGARNKRDRDECPGIMETLRQAWLLTGTPIMNRPKELFSLLRMTGHPLGQNWYQFGVRYCAARAGQGGMDFNGCSNMGELTAKIGNVYLKRMKTEVLNLPPKIRGPHVIDLDDSELRAYRKAVADMLGRLDVAEVGEDGEPKEGCVLAELNALKLQTARAKMPHTIEQAREILAEGGKVLVFSYYHEVLDALQSEFGSACVRIDGSVSPVKRQAIVDTFQKDPSKAVFLGQIEAAGVGLTLTAAQYVLVNDYPWTPSILDQAEDRTYRIGQTGTVNVKWMEARHTFDGKLKAILDAKREVITAFETGADASSKARMSVVKQLLKAIKKEVKESAA